MPPRELSKQEIKEEVINRLFRRGSWGSRYSNRQAIEKWVGSQVKDDGKQVGKALDELVKDFLVLEHKKGKTISLNTRRKKDIMKIIDNAYPF